MEISADTILIATGCSPWHPPGIPFDGKSIFDSDSILHMQRIPKSMAVVGGGVIGSEYASIFTALGVQVTLIDPKECILPFVDNEISLRLQEQLKSLGLKFALGCRLNSIERQEESVRLSLEDESTLKVEIVLVSMGRQSNVQGLGLERLGVQLALATEDGSRGDTGVVTVPLERALAARSGGGDPIDGTETLTTTTEGEKAPLTESQKIRIKKSKAGEAIPTYGLLSKMVDSGLLVSHAGNKMRFLHTVLNGYLAGQAIGDNEADQTLLAQPEWNGKSLALHYLAARGDASAVAEYLLKQSDLPLHYKAFEVARWLRDAPRNAA